MPIALVRSISLPNLKIYTTISLLLVSGCLYYAFDVVRTDPQWKLHYNSSHFATSRPTSLLKTSNDAISALTNSELLSSLTSSLTADEKEDPEIENAESIFEETNFNGTNTFSSQLKDVASFMTHEPVCIWVSETLILSFLSASHKEIRNEIRHKMLCSQSQTEFTMHCCESSCVYESFLPMDKQLSIKSYQLLPTDHFYSFQFY